MRGFLGQKHCIYLDQFAASNIFDSTLSNEWKELGNLVFEGVSKNLLVCPLSVEHFVETSSKTTQNALDHDQKFRTLSGGHCFKAEPFVTAQLISSLIRNNKITANTFLDTDLDLKLLDEDKIDKFRARKTIFDSHIQDATTWSNKIREIERTKKVTKDQVIKNTLLSAHKKLNEMAFLERLKELIIKKAITIQGVHFKAGEVPFWADYILELLIKKHKLKLKEFERLFAHIRHNGFRHIPTLDIRTTLSAYIAVNNKKENVNDQIDICRIATGLPFSDILLTDKARKFEILENGLDKKYDTIVLSGTREDLEIFTILLKKIMSGSELNYIRPASH